MHFERRNAFQNYIKKISQKKKEKRSVSTLPKIFRPVTQNTLIFFFALVSLYIIQSKTVFYKMDNFTICLDIEKFLSKLS